MKFKIGCLLIFTLVNLIFFKNSSAQDTTLVFGNKLIKQKLNYYDFSDPLKINFEVIVWGSFKNPGKYLVPENTTVIDLISFAGLPENSGLLKDVKLIRAKDITSQYSSSSVTRFNFQKFFNSETMDFTIANPVVKGGDILLIPIELERNTWDYIREGLLILGPLASILSLIVTLNK